MIRVLEVIKRYYFYDKNITYEKYGNGNINKTYLVKKDDWYIIQEINLNVFKEPNNVIYNINLLNEYLDNSQYCFKMIKLIKNLDGEYLTRITGYNDTYYRCYKYIISDTCEERYLSDDMIYIGGKVIGKFLKTFSGLDPNKLKIIIPDFHNTPKRYECFIDVYNNDNYFRKRLAEKECKYLMNNQYMIEKVFEYIKENKLPLRVCHNDTKLSNVLFNNNTNDSTLIDMDTIMPGYLIFDYADGIRSCISNLQEDSNDYQNLEINIQSFSLFTKGFLEETKDIIISNEVELLVEAVKVITYECALRFISDFLNNDKYFKTNYCLHNLVRTRNQIMLIEKIKEKNDVLENIVKNIYYEIKNNQ